MAENLTDYLSDNGVRVRYLHSDIDTVERIEIIRDLRLGEFDVLVGINLLREGLDMPEVSLVAIFDADKEGYLRSERSLIQTIGRSARNINGKAILYADRKTDSMERAIRETERRRQKQLKHNVENKIVPRGIQREISDVLEGLHVAKRPNQRKEPARKEENIARNGHVNTEQLSKDIIYLEKQMFQYAKELKFEEAAKTRDKIEEMRSALVKSE